MKISKGSVYRLGVMIKETGERLAHKKVFGIPALRWCCGPVISLGLIIKDSVIDRPMEEM